MKAAIYSRVMIDEQQQDVQLFFDELNKQKITPVIFLPFFNEIKEKGLSVRQTEALVRNLYKQSGAVKKSSKSQLPPAFQRIEDKLASHFSTRVKLRHSRNGSGQIIIEYYSQEELTRLIDLLSSRERA